MTALFLKIVEMAITAGFVVLGVLLLRRIWRKAPKWIAVLMWGLVAVRLLVPFSFVSPIGVLQDVSLPSVSTPSEPSESIVETPNTQAPTQDRLPIETYDELIDRVDAPSDVTVLSVSKTPSFVQVASTVWAFGVAAMLWYVLMSYADVRRRVRTAIKDEQGIYRAEAVGSPFILGLFRPRIYAPHHLEGVQLDAVLAHEHAHIKRGDHIIKPMAFLLLAVYWFQPLLWLAYILLCRDIELACDERVVKELEDDDRRSYSTALVASAVGHRRVAACPLAFGEVAVKERVKSVMHYRKPAVAFVVCALISVSIASVMLLTDQAKDAPVTFEGAKLVAVVGDMLERNVPLSGDEETPSFTLSNPQCDTFGFAVKDIDARNLSVTVCSNREIEHNGKMVTEIVVPYDETVELYPLPENHDLRFRLSLKFPQAQEDVTSFTEKCGNLGSIERYVSGDTVLYLYENHFHLSTNGDAFSTSWYTPQYYNWGTSNWFLGYTPSLPVDGVAEGTYEWVDNTTLYLTENGGLTQYVFKKTANGALKYQKALSSRHKRSHSPILPARTTLPFEYHVQMMCLDRSRISYSVLNSVGTTVFKGTGELYDLEIYSYDDGVVRVSDGITHRLIDLNNDTLNNGINHGISCAYMKTSQSTEETGYYPMVCEKDGKVMVKAQYSSWCMTAPPDNALYELDGLTSLRNGVVKAIVDGDEITIWYTDDKGDEHVIAESLRSVNDGKGKPITRPLIAMTEFDDDDQPIVKEETVYSSDSTTLVYHQITEVYVQHDGRYVDIERAFETGTLDAVKLMEIAEKAYEDGNISIKRERNGSVVYEFANTDLYHTIVFVPRADNAFRAEPAYTVHIGYISNKTLEDISEQPYLFYSQSLV